MKKTGMRTTLLGTKVECFHPVPDWDIVANLCKACGTTDEELSMGELGVDYPDEPEVPQDRTPMLPASFYIGAGPAISGSASLVQTLDQAEEVAEISKSMGKTAGEIPSVFPTVMLK